VEVRSAKGATEISPKGVSGAERVPKMKVNEWKVSEAPRNEGNGRNRTRNQAGVIIR